MCFANAFFFKKKNPVEIFLTKKDFSTGFSTFKQTFPQPLWKILEVFHRIVIEKVVFNQCIKIFYPYTPPIASCTFAKPAAVRVIV